MQKTSAASLRRQYERLRQSLAATGYISQGSVLDRSTLRPARHGYQWTRKAAGKTVTVALNREQFEAWDQAIKNHRRLRQTIGKMEVLSRRILFKNMPDTHRRKPLHPKVLGIN
jgi:hypothetical protein